MTLPVYQLDAFASRLFTGNPAAVIPLSAWPDDQLLQQIAGENNLSETAFFIPGGDNGADYTIRWFTPAVEVNLCGHATLATAAVLFEELGFTGTTLSFHSHSGILRVMRYPDRYALDFPSWKPERTDQYHESLHAALGNPEVVGVYRHRDLLVELQDEAAVQRCAPDFSLLKKHFRHVIITAPGRGVDFVSRFFAPASGIDEDPVTGSAHSQLIPFWSEKLEKKDMRARQLSARGGELHCRQVSDERVEIGGQCRMYMKGDIHI